MAANLAVLVGLNITPQCKKCFREIFPESIRFLVTCQGYAMCTSTELVRHSTSVVVYFVGDIVLVIC